MGSKANHHFIPQFYLRGFADGVGRQAKLFTFDNESKNSFTTQVRNVGSRRYFNRVEAEGVHPDALEDAFAEIDGEIAGYLAEVIEARCFPTDQHINSILNLIANISVRNPRLRENIARTHKELAKRIMDLSLATEDRWQSLSEQMKRDGVPLKDSLTYHDMKDFHERGEYEILINQTYLIGMEIELTEPVLDCLARRQWCFVTSPEGHDFITSDDPAVLSWKDGPREGFFSSPGHGLSDTLVYFPLSPRLALIGTYDDLPSEITYQPLQVTSANTLVARYAHRQIYARDSSFSINLADQDNVAGHELSLLIK